MRKSLIHPVLQAFLAIALILPALGAPGAGRAFAATGVPRIENPDFVPSIVDSANVEGSFFPTVVQTPIAVISGTVSLPNSTPSSGGSISFKELRDGAVAQTAQVDNAGHFSIFLLTVGSRYLILALPPEHSPANQSLPRVVQFDGTPQTQNFSLTETQLAGHVLRNGAGVQGASAGIAPSAIFSPTNPQISEYFTTDANGAFHFGGLADGVYSLAIRPNLSGVPSPGARSVTVEGGAVTRVGEQTYSGNVVFNLESTQGGGTVKNPDGQPAPFAYVEIKKPDLTYRSGVVAGIDGGFVFNNLADGAYDVTAFPANPNASPFGASAPVRVQVVSHVAAPNVLDLRLSAPMLTGIVQRPDGRGIQNAYVQLLRTLNPGEFEVGAGSSNGDGRFKIGNVPDGTYFVRTILPRELPFLPPAPSQVTLQSGSTVSVTLLASLSQKAVTGEAKLGGQGITDGIVYAYKQGGDGQSYAKVDASGRYTLPIPTGGTWLIGIAPPDGSDRSRPSSGWVYTQPPVAVTFSLDATPETKTVNFQVTRVGAIVAGHIVVAGGSPLPMNSLWVDIRDDSGHGNGGPVDGTGRYAIAVAPGVYHVRVSVRDDHFSVVGEPPLVNAVDNQSTSASDITIANRNLTISGRVIVQGASVQSADTTGVAGIQVVAFRQGGGDFVRTRTDDAGQYTLYVSSGVWQIQARPEGDDEYSPVSEPRLVVVTGQSIGQVDLGVLAATGRIRGHLMSDDATIDTSKLTGYAFALDGNGHQLHGSRVEGGNFVLNVPVGVTYTVGIAFPSGYDFGARPVIADLRSASVVTLNVPVLAANSTIVGHFVDRAGNPATNVNAEVHAVGDGGSRSARVDTSGTFTLKVMAGRWTLSAKLGENAAFSLIQPANNVVEVGSGATVTLGSDQNFVVAPISGAITGIVKTPEGTPMRGAWVWVEQPGLNGPEPRFAGGVTTDSNGAFTLRLSAGTYTVRAGAAQDLGFMPPAPQTVTVIDAPVTVNLQFRRAGSKITGSVVFTGTNEVYVTGYSTTGAHTAAKADASGSFTLTVTSNDTWIVFATSRNGKQVYRSPMRTVTVGSGDVTGVQLILAAVQGLFLPDGASVTFDASELKVLRLQDGTQVSIPAGALALSGTVTVMALPKEDLPAQVSGQPINIGYALVAKDANNVEIKHFLQNVTIVLPYPADGILAAMGITEASLIPSYWDSTAGAWKPADNVTPDFENNTFTISTDHFTDFAVLSTARTLGASSTTVFVPVSLSGYRSTGW